MAPHAPSCYSACTCLRLTVLFQPLPFHPTPFGGRVGIGSGWLYVAKGGPGWVAVAAVGGAGSDLRGGGRCHKGVVIVVGVVVVGVVVVGVIVVVVVVSVVVVDLVVGVVVMYTQWEGWCLPWSGWGWLMAGGIVTWQSLFTRQRLPCLLVDFGGSWGAGGLLAGADGCGA